MARSVLPIVSALLSFGCQPAGESGDVADSSEGCSMRCTASGDFCCNRCPIGLSENLCTDYLSEWCPTGGRHRFPDSYWAPVNCSLVRVCGSCTYRHCGLLLCDGYQTSDDWWFACRGGDGTPADCDTAYAAVRAHCGCE